MMSTITTYCKKVFDPLHATAADVDIRDIAHALSLMCRANGHFPYFYSVAQHCVNCVSEAIARGCSERVQLGCLLHDASEAYLSDITRPVKEWLPYYREVEAGLQQLIFDLWLTPPLTKDERTLVFQIDDMLLYHEFQQLTGEQVCEEKPALSGNLDFSFVPFAEMEQRFLTEFARLIK